MLKKAAVVYCSPGGSTRHVAQVIGQQLRNDAIDILSVDLGKGDDLSGVTNALGDGKSCLFIGSPVYASHPLPPVMQFIASLPKNPDIYAVPLVTWGGACSGIALHEMGEALIDRGFTLIGALKVLAVHSAMWRSADILGKGHPNQEDDRLVREMVTGVIEKMSAASPQAISLSDLAYQPEAVHAEMKKVTLEMAKAHMPERKIDEERCTECRVCAEICPVQAITLSPYPEFGKACIYCLQCVRDCPEEAIVVDLAPLEERIRGRAKQFNERPPTQIFI